MSTFYLNVDWNSDLWRCLLCTGSCGRSHLPACRNSGALTFGSLVICWYLKLRNRIRDLPSHCELRNPLLYGVELEKKKKEKREKSERECCNKSSLSAITDYIFHLCTISTFLLPSFFYFFISFIIIIFIEG
ncbi:hypothetical protein PUN28_010693 [Cardiocondyla obscurior]|uniref:Uncharacterized protein n=1 Tax=Cardiocondyla obscurior TaxID=286306 RepID=A0AAW2FHM3_9HYME